MCRAHDHRSPLSAATHNASLWHRMPVRGMKQFSRTCAIIQIKYVLAKTVSPAPVFVRIPGSHHPGTRLRLVPGFRDPGSILILGQVTQYGNPYLICITHNLADEDLSDHYSYVKWAPRHKIVWISIPISLKSVPEGWIKNIPALIRMMAWRRPDETIIWTYDG